MDKLGVRARLLTNPVVHALIPDRLAMMAAELVGVVRWRRSEFRREARGRLRLMLADTSRAGELDLLARRHLVESTLRHIVFWRPAMLGRSTLVGVGHLDEAASSGRGAIVMTLHLGANSLGQVYPLSRTGRHLHVLAGNWLFNEPPSGYAALRMAALKERGAEVGSGWVAVGGAFERCREILEAGSIVVLPFDVPGSHEVELLSKPAFVRTGIARLAEATGASIVPMFAGRNKHRLWVRLDPPIDPAEHDGIDALMAELARVVGAELLGRPHEREGSEFLDAIWIQRQPA